MEEKKPSRTGAIIGTIAAILLCGCPGLSLCVLGIWGATGTLPDYTGLYGGNLPGWAGFALLCVAIIFIAIGVVVPILLLRKKKAPEAAPADVLPPQEPLPPAS